MTPNVRREMLALAKKIANKEYKPRIERRKNLGTLQITEEIIPACVIMEDEIRWYLKENPEFDSSEFRKMIRDFQSRNKQIQKETYDIKE